MKNLKCPHCGEEDSIVLKLEDMVLGCSSCDEEITREEIEDTFKRWLEIFAWISKAPK